MQLSAIMDAGIIVISQWLIVSKTFFIAGFFASEISVIIEIDFVLH